eukprot:TRINITY_DN6138_c0_g1_i2.p1 TRINITY_DN6138_c0_g1~~TRINITY_DN6138_c0_g1_i2.p1  ORF type:complete len:131 (+),score=46.09 TRINITY_DN6138_c0_g1_i2:16-408(+)
MSDINDIDRGSVYIRDCFFFFQAEDGIRDAQESRGLGDVYKRQDLTQTQTPSGAATASKSDPQSEAEAERQTRRERELTRVKLEMETSKRETPLGFCLLYTSDAADEEDSVDLGGRRIIKKKNKTKNEHN